MGIFNLFKKKEKLLEYDFQKFNYVKNVVISEYNATNKESHERDISDVYINLWTLIKRIREDLKRYKSEQQAIYALDGLIEYIIIYTYLKGYDLQYITYTGYVLRYKKNIKIDSIDYNLDLLDIHFKDNDFNMMLWDLRCLVKNLNIDLWSRTVNQWKRVE